METKDLKKILARVPKWPREAQDELVRSMTEIETRYSRVYHVSDDERAALQRSAEDLRNNRLAVDSDVEAMFSRFHRP
jgi:hypothetical protein